MTKNSKKKILKLAYKKKKMKKVTKLQRKKVEKNIQVYL